MAPSKKKSDDDQVSGAVGRPPRFTGPKQAFLDEREDGFRATTKNTPGQRTFYNKTADAFIDQFGYSLEIGSNPPKGTDLASLKPIPIEGFEDGEVREEERKRRKAFKKELKVVRLFFLWDLEII
jgi:hypothetical protein